MTLFRSKRLLLYCSSMTLNRVGLGALMLALLLLWYNVSHRKTLSRNDQLKSYLPKVIFPARKQTSFTKIPKIIHQTWKGPTNIPLLFKEWIQSWIQLNADFEYWFWDDDDIEKLVEQNYPTYLKLFKSYPTSGYRADAFRYFVLYEHGGVYADLDSECLKSIRPVTEQYSCILSQEPVEHAHFLGPLGVPLVSNAIMACEARHPFFEHIITGLHSYTGWIQWSDILHTTGPYMLTKVYKEYSRSWFGHQVDPPYLADPEMFQPTIDNSMVDRIRERCMAKSGSVISDTLWSSHAEMQNKLCSYLMGFNFNNSPRESSYTNHHWTHTWATKMHDPWGVKNWRLFLNIQDLKPK